MISPGECSRGRFQFQHDRRILMKRNVQIGIVLVVLVAVGALVWLTQGHRRTHAAGFAGQVFLEVGDEGPASWIFNPNGTVTVFNPAGPRLLFSGSYTATAHNVVARLRDRSGLESSISFVIAENGSSLKSEDGKTILKSTGVTSGQ
jgi:hypothetical protein